MKTKTLFSKPLTYVMLALIISSVSCAPIHRSSITTTTGDDVIDNWEQFYAGASAGYGSTSVEDETVSSFCFGAEIMYNFLANDNGALYGGAFANYNTSSSDFLDENLLRVGARARYFDHIIPSRRLQAVYGVDAYALSGSREFSSSAEDDISGFGASAIVGLNLNLENDISLGFEAPVFNYWDQTFEYDGGEFDVNTTSFGINKNNLIMAYIRFGF